MFTEPTTVKGLQKFAGMVNFYHRFILKRAHITRPIYILHWQASLSTLNGQITLKKLFQPGKKHS